MKGKLVDTKVHVVAVVDVFRVDSVAVVAAVVVAAVSGRDCDFNWPGISLPSIEWRECIVSPSSVIIAVMTRRVSIVNRQ